MRPHPSINFKEEFSAKIPALTLLMNLGYTYLSPEECNKRRHMQTAPTCTDSAATYTRASTNQVMLLSVLTEYLAKQTFRFEGREHPLSDAGINKVIHALAPAIKNYLNSHCPMVSVSKANVVFFIVILCILI